MIAPLDKPSIDPRPPQSGGAAAPTKAAPAVPLHEADGPAPDLGALIRRALAHWQVALVALLVGGLVTALVVRTRKPSYKSETVIFYREGIGKSVIGAGDGVDIRGLGTKLKETLLAQQNLRRIIDELHLYPDIVMRAGYADAVDLMRKKTDFKSRSQDTFAISFEGTTRDEAQRVCARMAELLVAENAKRLAEDNRSTTAFLEAEKRRADEELARLEREVSAFIHAHPEFAGATDGLGTESMAQRKKIEGEERRRAAQARVARQPHEPAPARVAAQRPAPAAVDPVLIQARAQAFAELSAARKDFGDKSMRFTPAHPDVRAAEARVASAEAALKVAEDAIASAQKDEAPPAVTLDDPYAEPESTAKPPAALPNAAPAGTAPPEKEPQEKVVSLELEWERLSRARSLARSRQNDLEQKHYRAEMIASTAESGYGSSMAVLDPAYKPSGPSNAPNKTVLAAGLVASLVVGLALSAAWGLFLDDRVFSPAEIETIVMVPVIGVVPRERARRRERKGARRA